MTNERDMTILSISMSVSEYKSSSICLSVFPGSGRVGAVVVERADFFMVGVVLLGFWVIRPLGFKEAGF